jgi:hypothetical protein
MRSNLPSLALLYSLFGLAISAEQKAEPSSADDILLKLDYGTYRGYYNNTNEVHIKSSFFSSVSFLLMYE